MKCPLGKCSFRKIARQAPFSFCKGCRLIFYNKGIPTDYEKNYFFEEYKTQYGRSYLDDKINIQKKMKKKWEILKQYTTSSQSKRLLEVGSACGFFLELTKESNFIAEGWEISSYMAKIANRKDCFTRIGSFRELYQKWGKKPEKFDILVAFYAIEHFQDIFFFWEAAGELLVKGGILALALPSSFGPSFYFRRQEWIRNHPKDHFADHSPQSLRRFASFFGFELLKVSAEGIHPERFPLGTLPVFKKIYEWFQEKYAFSDTIFAILKHQTR